MKGWLTEAKATKTIQVIIIFLLFSLGEICNDAERIIKLMRCLWAFSDTADAKVFPKLGPCIVSEKT